MYIILNSISITITAISWDKELINNKFIYKKMIKNSDINLWSSYQKRYGFLRQLLGQSLLKNIRKYNNKSILQ